MANEIHGASPTAKQFQRGQQTFMPNSHHPTTRQNIDLIVLDLIFICNGLVCIFVFLCVSLDHFRFVICNLVLLGLVFLSTKPRDWLGRTSPK